MENPRLDGERTRQMLAAQAAGMGITEAFIDDLVETFYARVRVHPLLGPVFNTAIADWPAHLARMKDFWSSLALWTGRYHGKPVRAHQSMPGLTPALFPPWLALFRDTLADIAPSPQAAAFFMDRADRVAATLKAAVERPATNGH
ncbi:MAG: group III truncated hemoglobin [Azospirillaceae bacterium]|nr:group III truncated hemoglobin [Azospirillaceae bacterium]